MAILKNTGAHLALCPDNEEEMQLFPSLVPVGFERRVILFSLIPSEHFELTLRFVGLENSSSNQIVGE